MVPRPPADPDYGLPDSSAWPLRQRLGQFVLIACCGALVAFVGATIMGLLVGYRGSSVVVSSVIVAVVLGTMLARVVVGMSAAARPLDRYLGQLATRNGWVYLPRFRAPVNAPVGRASDSRPIPARGFDLSVAGLPAWLFESVWSIAGLTGEDASVALLVQLALSEVPRFRVLPRYEGSLTLLPIPGWKSFELESVEFNRRFVLQAGEEVDDQALVRLFSPALISGILDLAVEPVYLGECYEAANGWLLVTGSGTFAIGDGPAIEETLRRVEPLIERFRAGA